MERKLPCAHHPQTETGTSPPMPMRSSRTSAGTSAAATKIPEMVPVPDVSPLGRGWTTGKQRWASGAPRRAQLRHTRAGTWCARETWRGRRWRHVHAHAICDRRLWHGRAIACAAHPRPCRRCPGPAEQCATRTSAWSRRIVRWRSWLLHAAGSTRCRRSARQTWRSLVQERHRDGPARSSRCSAQPAGSLAVLSATGDLVLVQDCEAQQGRGGEWEPDCDLACSHMRQPVLPPAQNRPTRNCFRI